jgi:signal transduction histidine kinase
MLAFTRDTEAMLRKVNWLSRLLGFAWVGIVAFVLVPPAGRPALVAQVVCYCVVAAALGVWLLLDAQPDPRHRTRWLPVVLGVIAVASGLASATGDGGTAMLAFAAVAALVAGGDMGLGPSLAVTVAGMLAIEVCGLAVGRVWQILVGFPAVVLGGLLVGRNRGAYRVQAEQAAALLAQREQLQAEQLRADLLDERARIAREIHDVLAHSLGALSIQIQAARAVLTDDGDIDRAGEILAAAQRMTAEGLVDTRRAVHALRSDTLPLDEELARVSGTHAERYQVEASFAVGGGPVPLPPDATIALLRVAQESLVNAAKHAAGQPVAVCLDYGDDDVRLTVRNGLAPGPAAAAPVAAPGINGGYGLTGMRERLRLLDGTLEAGCRDGEWIVTARVPSGQAPAVAS